MELTYTQEQRMNRLVNRIKFSPADMLQLATTYYVTNNVCWNDEDFVYLHDHFDNNIESIVGKILGRQERDKVWAEQGGLVEFDGEMVQPMEWLYDEEWDGVRDIVSDTVWAAMQDAISEAAVAANLVDNNGDAVGA